MRSFGLLVVRLVVGGLLAGHGAQKLFGSFGGYGLQGTAQWLESLRLRPGGFWARLAGGSEFFGGLLTAAGALNPIGPVLAIGSMLMATTKVHLGKPVWSTKGGAELPVTNIAVLAALAIGGPGKLSLDRIFGVRVPRRLGLLAALGMLGTVFVASGREIVEGTSELEDEEVGGDPGADAEDRAAVESPGGAAGGGGERAGSGDHQGGGEKDGGQGAGATTDTGSREGTSVDAPTPSGPDMRAGGGVAVAAIGMRPSPERDEISESLKSDVQIAEAQGAMRGAAGDEGEPAGAGEDAGDLGGQDREPAAGDPMSGMGGSELDDQYRVGEAGSDAGTSMGTGSTLGSETPESEL